MDALSAISIGLFLLGIFLPMVLPAARGFGIVMCVAAVGLIVYGYLTGADTAQPQRVTTTERLVAPDVVLHFVNPQAPALWLENRSGVVAENIKTQFAMCNLDDPATVSADGDTIRFVSIPNPQFYFDFLRPHHRSGAMAIFEHPETTAAIRPGHRVFGFAHLTCPTCARDRMYWLFVVVGQRGWYSELPDGQLVDMKEYAKAIPTLMKSPDPEQSLIPWIPAEQRVPIPTTVPD